MTFSFIPPLIPSIDQRRRHNSRTLILVVARRRLNRPPCILLSWLIRIVLLSSAFFENSPHIGSVVFPKLLNISICVASEWMGPFRVRPGRTGEEGED